MGLGGALRFIRRTSCAVPVSHGVINLTKSKIKSLFALYSRQTRNDYYYNILLWLTTETSPLTTSLPVWEVFIAVRSSFIHSWWRYIIIISVDTFEFLQFCTHHIFRKDWTFSKIFFLYNFKSFHWRRFRKWHRHFFLLFSYNTD